MANVSRVSGFRPSRYLNNAPYNGACHLYSTPAADATAIFVGDLVKLNATANASGIRGVSQAAAGDAVVGVVVGFVVDYSNLNAANYRVASTQRLVLVADDPQLLFQGQEDGDTSSLDMVDAGMNVNFIVAAGSTATGQSGMQIDSSTVATTATLPLKLMNPVQSPGNELVALGQAYTRWEVKINNHQLAASTGTAGV